MFTLDGAETVIAGFSGLVHNREVSDKSSTDAVEVVEAQPKTGKKQQKPVEAPQGPPAFVSAIETAANNIVGESELITYFLCVCVNYIVAHHLVYYYVISLNILYMSTSNY